MIVAIIAVLVNTEIGEELSRGDLVLGDLLPPNGELLPLAGSPEQIVVLLLALTGMGFALYRGRK